MSIEQLSSQTRLNIKFIQALESGRRDLLPGQIYLKPFVKTCAQALDLNVKELYKIIDGETGVKEQEEERRIEFQEVKKKRRDFKLPVVLLIAAVIIVIIYYTMSTRDSIPPRTRVTEVIPANATKIRDVVNWNKPWERPPFYVSGSSTDNLVLMPSGRVGALVLAGDDTLFNGVLNAGENKVFLSEEGFTLNLTRNEQVSGFINGREDQVIGSGGGELENYRVGEQENR